MAHIPTLRTLANMKAKEIPTYLSANASLTNFRSFLRDADNWYYAKFFSKPKVEPFWHIMAFCSLVQLAVVTPYHAWKHHFQAHHGGGH